MPPKFDVRLEERILKAAERICAARGGKGLTLRAVARHAKTTTPTVYKRFRNKQALQVALAHRFRDELAEHCLAARTVEEAYRRYVRFAEDYPHKYELLWLVWTEVFRPDRPRPIRTWLLEQLANRFGGNPEQYALTFYAIFLMSHGAATLLTVPGNEDVRKELRDSFLAISDAILRRGETFQSERSGSAGPSPTEKTILSR